MELKDIKNLNQRIYELSTDISRSNKTIFIAAIIFCLQNKDFQNPNKLTDFINFSDETKKPIDRLLEIAKTEIDKLKLNNGTKSAVLDSLNTISGVQTNLNRNRMALKDFLLDFISNWYPSIKPADLFFETLYMEIDKKASNSDKGIVLTPVFIAQLMVDLASIDYKKDVIADLCSGTGLFSLLSYSTMLSQMDKDLKAKLINPSDYEKYQARLFNSIIANDNEPKMVTLCLANFLLKSLNHSLIYSEDVLKLEKSSFKINIDGNEVKIQPTKAILNPPYEDKYKPMEIIEKNISLVQDSNSRGNKVVVIVPPQKFGQKKDVFSRILNISTLETVIKTQEDLFTDSGKAQPASIFVFNVDKPHDKNDIVHYYNFTDTGYVYLKDSGLVDKNHTFEKKKNQLLDKIRKASKTKKVNSFNRTWFNFYEVNKELEVDYNLDPKRIKFSKEDADITLENITIKRMLEEKKELIDSVGNNFKDSDGKLENYIVDILSED